MPSTVISPGQIILSRLTPAGVELPPRMDKKGIKQFLADVEEKAPDQYVKVLHGLIQLGKHAAYTEGLSISAEGLRRSKAKQRLMAQLRKRIDQIKDRGLDEDAENELIFEAARPYIDKISDEVLKEGLEEGNPYAQMVDIGARGKPGDFSALVGSEVLYQDASGKPIPFVVESSYAEGLDPAEYWAAGYGGRKGLVDVKLSTADAGFLSKRLVNAAHRQVITDERPLESRLPTGYPTTADDNDNVGAVLAQPVAGFEAGEVITPSILKQIKRKAGDKRFLVHSPITSRTKGGGLDRLSAGRRERRELAGIGENVGIPAAQAVGERISQGALSSKHAGGAAGEDRADRIGFEYLNRLIEAPETFPEAGVVSKIDGRVKSIEEAPQGGHYVYVDDERVYVPSHRKITVKPGQELEAGDMLSDGIPHPRDLVRYQGIGEARRQFTELLTEGLRNSGVPVHRRNAEALSASIINHIKVTDIDGIGNYTVDDVTPYSALFGQGYEPRIGATRRPVDKTQGRYLEEPVLHYTPGTRITKRVIKDLRDFGVADVDTHEQPPAFEPEMVRGVMTLTKDPDWMTQQGGFHTGKAFLESARRGAVSQQRGSTSFYGALAKGETFGKDLKTKGTF